MNRIKFLIDTDAPYTASEIEDLLSAFVEFMVEQDGDVNVNAADVEVFDVDSAEDGISAEKKKEIVEEFLKNASVISTVSISDENVATSFNLD